MARNRYTHAGERVVAMLADVRARFSRITKNLGCTSKDIAITSTKDALLVTGHQSNTHDYDSTTMWTTLRRLQLRIVTFASKKLTYSTVSTPAQQDHSDSEDGLDEDYEIEALDTSNEHNFNFQTNTTPSSNGGYSVSFNSLTACLENVRKCIKTNVALWKSGKSQSIMNKLNGSGQDADEAMYAYLKSRDGPPASSI